MSLEFSSEPAPVEPSPIRLSNPTFRRFIAVNVVFVAGMAALLFNNIKSIPLWIGYIAVWWWAETKVAHGLPIGWKGWTVFFGVLGVVDVSVIWLASGH